MGERRASLTRQSKGKKSPPTRRKNNRKEEDVRFLGGGVGGEGSTSRVCAQKKVQVGRTRKELWSWYANSNQIGEMGGVQKKRKTPPSYLLARMKRTNEEDGYKPASKRI